MTTATRHRLVEDYLRALRASARQLPHSHRDELVQQIEEHIDAAIAPDASEADTRTALDRLGAPEMIVAEEANRLGIRPVRMGIREWFVLFLLPFGAVVIPILGWVVGVGLLWVSRVWSVREKVIGTLLPPGGLSTLVYLLLIDSSSCAAGSGGARRTAEHCTGGRPAGVAIVLVITFGLTGIATPVFLARRASRSYVTRNEC